MNSGSSGSYDKPRNQELDNSSSHVPHVTDFNSQPSTTFKTENVWLNAVSDIIKQDSFADGESMTGIHLYSENNTTADPTSQIVPVQNQNAQFLRSGAGVGIGSSIKAYSHTSPFESSELGKKRTRRNLVTEENSLDDILSQITSKLTNLCSVTSDGQGNEMNASFNPEESIKAFIDVLKCPHMEASFYLESSDWNIETAVLLWLENNPNPSNLMSSASEYNPFGSSNSNNNSSSNNHYSLGDVSHPGSRFPNNRFRGYVDEDDEYEFKRSAGQVNADGLVYPFRRRPAWARTSGISRRWLPRAVEIAGLDPEWSARVSRTTGRIIFKHIPTGKEQSTVPAGFADPVTEEPKNGPQRVDAGSGEYGEDQERTGDYEAMEKEAEPVYPDTDLSANNDCEGMSRVDYSASFLPTDGNYTAQAANQTDSGFDMDIPSGDMSMMGSRASSSASTIAVGHAIDSYAFLPGTTAAPNMIGSTIDGDVQGSEQQQKHLGERR